MVQFMFCLLIFAVPPVIGWMHNEYFFGYPNIENDDDLAGVLKSIETFLGSSTIGERLDKYYVIDVKDPDFTELIEVDDGEKNPTKRGSVKHFLDLVLAAFLEEVPKSTSVTKQLSNIIKATKSPNPKSMQSIDSIEEFFAPANMALLYIGMKWAGARSTAVDEHDNKANLFWKYRESKYFISNRATAFHLLVQILEKPPAEGEKDSELYKLFKHYILAFMKNSPKNNHLVDLKAGALFLTDETLQAFAVKCSEGDKHGDDVDALGNLGTSDQARAIMIYFLYMLYLNGALGTRDAVSRELILLNNIDHSMDLISSMNMFRVFAEEQEETLVAYMGTPMANVLMQELLDYVRLKYPLHFQIPDDEKESVEQMMTHSKGRVRLFNYLHEAMIVTESLTIRNEILNYFKVEDVLERQGHLSTIYDKISVEIGKLYAQAYIDYLKVSKPDLKLKEELIMPVVPTKDELDKLTAEEAQVKYKATMEELAKFLDQYKGHAEGENTYELMATIKPNQGLPPGFQFAPKYIADCLNSYGIIVIREFIKPY